MLIAKNIVTLNYVSRGDRKVPLVYIDLCRHLLLLKDPLSVLIIPDLGTLRLSQKSPQETFSVLQ